MQILIHRMNKQQGPTVVHRELHSISYNKPQWKRISKRMYQMVKNPPAVWKTWARSLGWDDPLEEGMATHSSMLAWRIPGTEEPGRLQSMGSQSDTVERLSIAQHIV